MSEIFEIVRLFIFWVAFGLNITGFVMSNRAFNRWRQKYEECCELYAQLRVIIAKENEFLLKLKEKQENELHS